jgi:hypothetical protein
LAGRLARIALIAPALQRLKRNAVRTAIGIGLVAVLGGLGLTYLLIALRYQLEREIGPLWTPVAIGGVLALAALVAYAALLRPRRARRAVASEPVGLPPELAAPLRNIESTVSKNPLPSIAVALAAGFAAAAVLRMVRRPRPGAPRGNDGYNQAPPHPAGAERPAWMREVVLRETDRRRANGRSP